MSLLTFLLVEMANNSRNKMWDQYDHSTKEIRE